VYIGVELDKQKHLLFTNFVSNVHYCIPYKGIIFVAEKPIGVYWSNGRLHRENGPAVEYKDGYGVFSLNGVRMNEEYVMTKAEDIKPETVLKEENVDMRRELLRKVGVERMSSYGKVIDTQGKYKLLDMAKLFMGVEYAPHLMMVNPSLKDTYHLEGVSQECRTVEQAINWRAGGIKWEPALLS